jgi:hypothetical protein
MAAIHKLAWKTWQVGKKEVLVGKEVVRTEKEKTDWRGHQEII